MAFSPDRAIVPDTLFGELQRYWRWLLALGILFIVLGVIGLGMTFALTLASVLFFGFLLLIGGGIQLVQAFQCKGWKSITGHVLIALLYVVAGITIVFDPVGASIILTLILAAALIAIGIVRIVMALQLRGTRNWGWLLAGGIIAVLLGVLIMVDWPVTGLWVIGLFVAIELIVHGWTYIFVALSAKEAGKSASAGTEARV